MNRNANRCLALIAVGCGIGAAVAAPLSLIQDYGAKGMSRLCKYSDRALYTVEANRACPIRIAGPRNSAPFGPAAIGKCLGSSEGAGPCSTAPGGGLSAETGGGLSSGPRGGLSTEPGGGLSTSPGGGMNSGASGGLSAEAGGGLFTGPGGGLSAGPRSGRLGEYKGPWGPCITGAATIDWLGENCPNRR